MKVYPELLADGGNMEDGVEAKNTAAPMLTSVDDLGDAVAEIGYSSSYLIGGDVDQIETNGP